MDEGTQAQAQVGGTITNESIEWVYWWFGFQA